MPHIYIDSIATAHEIASRYRISRQAVTRACRKGQVKARQLGNGLWLLNRADADRVWGQPSRQYLAAHK